MNALRPDFLLLIVLIGVAAGIGAFTFVYARGYSYLTDDPAACANCHIMNDHFSGWMKSSHKAAAVCNDCHTPSGFVAKYATKASNGFWHSVAFTTGTFPDPIRIKPHNRDVANDACMKCHETVTASMLPGGHAAATGAVAPHVQNEQVSCVRCHASVGHWVR